MRLSPLARPLAAAALLASLGGCAHKGPDAPAAPTAGAAAERPPESDSVTVALWRFDEAGGIRCADAGPYGIAAIAGNDARTEFGRFRNARLFARASESFAIARYNPVFDSPNAFTIEAWVKPASYGAYELSTIAARWTPTANEQTWLFALVGQRLKYPTVSPDSPGTFDATVAGGATGRLVFLLQPELAAGERAFFSTATVPVGKWTHVAASYDGEVVRLFIGGRMDAQYAMQGGIRPSPAPVLIGNFFDPRKLSDFSGTLRPEAGTMPAPFYAFDGDIDELRLSNAGRVTFESLASK